MKSSVGAACLGIIALAAGSWFGAAQPAAPKAPTPERYRVVLRYRILAPRDQHALLYDELIAHLQRLKFEFDPPLDERPWTDRIDPSKNEIRGSIGAGQAARLRDHPNVGGVLLIPEGFKAPEAGDQPVRVRLELVSGLTSDRQRDLADQTRLLLTTLGFKEAVAYDHRGWTGRPFTRLVGAVPAGQLETLLKDLRRQPSGWLSPQIGRGDLPSPLRELDPIWITEVLADAEPLVDAAEPPVRTPTYLEKLGPGVFEAVNDKEREHAAVRVQIIFAGELSPNVLRHTVGRVAPSAFIEGILGSYVTSQMSAAHARALAALPEVIAVRLPPPPRIDVSPELPADFQPAQALQQTGLAVVHAGGKRGQGVRLAIVDTDFRGWREQVKAGKLPATTRLIDLTAERSPDLMPAAEPAGAGLGHGTQCAIAAAVAAPAADLALIRIVGDDPHQLAEVRAALDTGAVSATLERRLDELRVTSVRLALRRNRLLAERKKILESFLDEEDLRHDFGFLGPAYGWLFSERDWHRQSMDNQAQLERELTGREERYWKLVGHIQGLAGTPLVASALSWSSEYPLGGASPLSRALDAPTQGPVWFQSAGNTAGQSWSGSYRDADNNDVMEFGLPGAKLPAQRWSDELAFLGWQPFAGKGSAVLPEKSSLRVSLQWREPHAPDYFLPPGEEDPYRRPLAELRLVLLRQRDPEGKTLGRDAFDVVARSGTIPGRLEHQPGGSVYELTLEHVVAQAGRFAIRVERAPSRKWAMIQTKDRYVFELQEGLTPTGTRPVDAPTLPALEKTWELQPRLFVETTDDDSRRQGRPQLVDFATTRGAVGVPADAHGVIAVGAADAAGHPRSYSAQGAPPFMDLAAKPTIWAPDALRWQDGGAWGASLANAYAAGAAATLLSSGMNRDQLLENIRAQHGRMFRAERTR